MNLSAIVKPCQLNTYQQGKVFCQFDANKVVKISPQLFDAKYWQQKNAIIGSAQGRGTTWFIKTEGQEWVLRHYYRGGLIGKLINDSYLYQGMAKTRAAQEFNLLAQMQKLALPAPQAIAYQVIRHGLFYRADLITQRIENAIDLVELLTQKSLDSALWEAIGKTIKSFHQHGIYHHDLNAHNILIDDNKKVWLIDFDRGEQRTVASQWQESNMQRLLRSFNKEKNKLPTFHWQPQHWQQLLKGYHL